MLTMLQALTVKGPVTESALRAELAGGDQFYPSEIIPMAISRLRASGQVRRTDDGMLEAIVQCERVMPTPLNNVEVKEGTEMSETRACSTCRHDLALEKFDGDKKCCRICAKKAREAYAAKHGTPIKHKALAKSPALKNLKAKAAHKRNGAVPLDMGENLVAVTFSLKIEDINGIFHQISVSRPIAQRLVTELQEHA